VQELLAVIAITAATFVATSFDNLVLLVGFLSDPEYRREKVAVGYVASATIVTGLAWGLSEIADEIPAQLLGFLGLIPIAIGLWELVGLMRRREVVDGSLPGNVAAKGILSVGSVMMASSGDTFAVLLALLADTANTYTIPMLATVALSALVLYGFAVWLRSHPLLERPLSRVARYALPFLLIGIGLYILANSGTDVVVG